MSMSTVYNSIEHLNLAKKGTEFEFCKKKKKKTLMNYQSINLAFNFVSTVSCRKPKIGFAVIGGLFLIQIFSTIGIAVYYGLTIGINQQ